MCINNNNIKSGAMDDDCCAVMQEAIELYTHNNLKASFAKLISVLRTDLDWKYDYENLFVKVVLNLSNHLLFEGELKEFFECFERAFAVFPKNAWLKYTLAKILDEMGHTFRAFIFMSMAYKINPEKPLYCRDLDRLKNSLVPQWHFRMLNDTIRNNAYRKAILECVTEGSSVLDIGCGSGILSMFALEKYPQRLIALDYSEALCSVATSVLNDNNIDKIVVKNCSSTTLHAEDILGQVSVVITEIFDAGFFGEGVLETLIHARRVLMKNLETDVIIPQSGSIYICGMESDTLRRKFCVQNAVANRMLKLKDLVIYDSCDQHYDTEDLTKISDLQYITQVSKCLDINFLDLNHMENLQSGKAVLKCTLRSKQRGTLHALGVWFQLHLCKGVSITTDPRCGARSKAWEQAIFHLIEPIVLDENITLEIELSCKLGKLAVTNIQHYQLSDIKKYNPVPSAVVRTFNDDNFFNICSEITHKISLQNSARHIEEIEVVDLSLFPALGLLLLISGCGSLTCYAESSEIRQLILSVAASNQINIEKIKFLHEKRDVNHLNVHSYKIMINMLLNSENNLNTDEAKHYLMLKQHVNGSSVVMIPHKIRMLAKLIYSDELKRINRVDDCNVVGYKVAESMNVFQLTQTHVSDMATIPFHSMSESVLLCDQVVGFVGSTVTDVEVISDGKVNAIMYWFDFQMLEHGDCYSTLAPNSLADINVVLLDIDFPAPKHTQAQIKLIAEESYLKLTAQFT